MLDELAANLIFEYQYRDASNYKVQGELLLTGALSLEQKNRIMNKFEDKEFFIAEQIGVPPLYNMLYEFSDGPTSDDHVWHEFLAFRQSEFAMRCNASCVSASDFFQRILAVDRWDIELSSHCD